MKSKDFVTFVHSVAKKWGWTNYNKIVKIERLGWSTTYLVGLKSKAVREIYLLSGPAADGQKDRYFKHIFSLRKPGQHGLIGETKAKILSIIEKKDCTSNSLSLELNIGIQNIQRTLRSLADSGMISKEWKCRGYCYSRTQSNIDAIDANQNIL